MNENSQYDRLQTSILDCELPNNLVLASGPRSFNAAGIWDAFSAGAGAVVTKTIRAILPQNPTPHISIPISNTKGKTLINAEEWSDLSWEQWVFHEIPRLQGHPGALIVSVGQSVQDVEVFIDSLVSCDPVDMIECVSYSGEMLIPLLKVVRKSTDLPVLAKLSFNWGSRIFSIAEQAIKAGCNGFTAIDSIGPALSIDINTAKPRLASLGGRGWISGEAIKPLALSIIADLKSRLDKPVFGTGGVFSAEDVIEMMMAGADAVGVCSAPILYGNQWFTKTISDLDQWLDRSGFSSINELVGFALPNLRKHQNSNGLEFNFNPELCTLCRKCEIVCPYTARHVTGQKAYDKHIQMSLLSALCRSCGLCTDVCKTQALDYEIIA